MTPVAAFAMGAFTAAVISFIIFGRLVTVWYDKKLEADQTILEHEGTIETLKAQKTPTWQVGVGVDNVARRNPTVVPLERTPIESIDELPTLYRIGEQDVWDSSIGGYRNVH